MRRVIKMRRRAGSKGSSLMPAITLKDVLYKAQMVPARCGGEDQALSTNEACTYGAIRPRLGLGNELENVKPASAQSGCSPTAKNHSSQPTEL